MSEVRCFRGEAVRPYLPALAALRMQVFRDWPYLYEGDQAYEERYLATYAASAGSLFVLAFDGERAVGASTAIPLVDEMEALRQPFILRGIEPARVFYFGESVLLPAWRGRGIGHRFFDEREAAARRGGFPLAAFCAVERNPLDARRPPQYRELDRFWHKRGYRRQDDLSCELEWRERGQAAPTAQRLRFWLRELETT